MDISGYEKGYTLFACYCDFDEIDDSINDAKQFCHENSLTPVTVKIVRGQKEINSEIVYFVLVIKK